MTWGCGAIGHGEIRRASSQFVVGKYQTADYNLGDHMIGVVAASTGACASRARIKI
jgi:hypothetical protein